MKTAHPYSIYAPFRCYLTHQANHAVKQLELLGLDEDLAISVLEQLWPEDAIFSVDDDEDDENGQRRPPADCR